MAVCAPLSSFFSSILSLNIENSKSIFPKMNSVSAEISCTLKDQVHILYMARK